MAVAATKLLGRDTETRRLAAAWEAARGGTPQLVVVWGRRRVGKTFLLSHFTKGKRAVFYGATQQSEAVELRRFADAVARDLGDHAADLTGGGFSDWEAALRFLSALAQNEPLIVVLDEVPYLTSSTPGFTSIVQSVWDHLPTTTNLMLVLTGSAVGTIESMLGSGGALRGRPTLTLRLDPLDPVAARLFLPRLDPDDFLVAYAACGGYPQHLLAWDQTSDVDANLLRLAGTPGGLLVENAESIVYEELPDTGGYPRILAAVGRGRTRMSEIASEAGQRVEHPLEVLIRSGFVRRSVPVGAPRRSRPLYEIADPYLAFWFGLLYSDRPQIDAGQGRAVLRRGRSQMQRHVAWVFEEAARAHAARLVEAGTLPPDLLIGRWWTSSGPACEVDVLGLAGNRTALLGEARWQERRLGQRDLNELVAKTQQVPDMVEDPWFALWGRTGVDRRITGRRILGFNVGDVLRG